MCVSVCTDMFITYLESEPVGMTAAVSIGQRAKTCGPTSPISAARSSEIGNIQRP